jgi:autoinducer 2-degrading protein
MENTISWVLEMTVKPGQLDTLKELMEQMVAATSAEPGATNYEWYLSEDGTTLHIYERYVDSDAAVAHGASFVANWAAQFMSCLDVTRLTVYGNPSESLRKAFESQGPTYLGTLGGFAR